MARRADIVDTNTGEVLVEGYLCHERPRSKMPFKRWFMVNQDAADMLAGVHNGTDSKVFGCLTGTMNIGNIVSISQKEVAKRTGLTPTQVSLSIKRLIEAGLIRKEDGQTGYIVNEQYAWKGDAKSYPLPRSGKGD